MLIWNFGSMYVQKENSPFPPKLSKRGTRIMRTPVKALVTKER